MKDDHWISPSYLQDVSILKCNIFICLAIPYPVLQANETVGCIILEHYNFQIRQRWAKYQLKWADNP